MGKWELIIDYISHSALEIHSFEYEPKQTEFAGVVVYRGRVAGVERKVFIVPSNTCGWTLEEVEEE